MPDDKARVEAKLWCDQARKLLGLSPISGDTGWIAGGSPPSAAGQAAVKDIVTKLDNLPPPAGSVDDAIELAAKDVKYARGSTPQLRELNALIKSIDDADLAKLTEDKRKELAALKEQLDDYFSCGDLSRKEYLRNGTPTKGHGPQRHEGQLSDEQLADRAMHGKDPMTGTTSDGVHGGEHRYSKNATSVVSPKDYIEGESFLRNSPAFTTAPVSNGRKKVQIPLEEIYGSDYKSAVRGKTRVGSKANPTGSQDTDFTDGALVAIYQQADDGAWHLLTMYPDPKP